MSVDFIGPSNFDNLGNASDSTYDKGTTPGDVSRQTAPEGTPWSAPTLSAFTGESFDSLTAAQRSRIAKHFAWAEKMPPESFGQLKLPHHRASDGRVIWRGVAAAMGALLGARGGVAIPGGDRRSVYSHLKSHYGQFDKEPPEFRDYTEAEVKEIFEKVEGDKHYAPSYVVKANEDGSTRFRLTERRVDRDGEVVESEGGRLDNFKLNPVVLWGHGRTGLMGGFQGSISPIPIGKIDPDSIKQTKRYIDGDVIFDEEDPFAALIGNKVRNGFLNTGSIGFAPITVSEEAVLPNQTGVTFVQWELLEFSIVPIPALQTATARRDFDDLVSKSIEYNHPLATEYIDLVQNFMDDNAVEIETPKKSSDMEFRLRAALLELDLTAYNITRPR